ncbi:MAG: hypothetical protein B7Z74_07905 [Deltaproteobacteria bacterium 21-66-5]|nr:MAG: hypothetical protein B7Z74_07905 [Deltaproteobacteria bacterium 21-66-5]
MLRRTSRLEHRSVAEILGADSDASTQIYSISEFSAEQLLDQMPVDVIIDFSSEEGLSYYGAAAAARGVAIVSAVSHYSESKQRELARLAVRTRVLWSPNITLGVNFLMLASQTLQRIAPELDVHVIEEHFREKASVSGTAKRIAEGLCLSPDKVHVIRAGGIIGVHEVLFGFPAQTVRLRHEAISRDAFGNGAVFAAQHLINRPAGLYRLEDLLIPYFALDVPLTTQHALETNDWRRRMAKRLRGLAQRVEGRATGDEVPAFTAPAPTRLALEPPDVFDDASELDEVPVEDVVEISLH